MSWWDKILRLLGTNEQQRRWNRHRREREREAEQRSRENRARHLKYEHKLCPKCGAVNDREAESCAVCEARLPSWRTAQLEKWITRVSPGVGAMTNALLLVNGVIFLLVVLDTGSVWGPNGLQSIAWGANYGPLMTAGGEWWRLITANFLHVGGLIHIAFNLFALAQIGPLVEQFYGTSRATVIYLGTAILSCVASHLWNPMAISGGASGALMGLVGAGVVAGHLEGGGMGHAVRNSLLKWVVFIALFGLLVPNIDNAAHFGGFAAGGLLGLGLKQERRAGQAGHWVYRGVAAVLVALTALALLLGGLSVASETGGFQQTAYERSISECRTAVADSSLSHETPSEDDVRPFAEICDRAARVDGFYRNPQLTWVAALLWRQAGEPDRANRIEAILRASGGVSESSR